jgi:hypothetical protein
MGPHLSFTECTKAGSLSPHQRSICVCGWRRQAQAPGRLDAPTAPGPHKPMRPNRDRRHTGSSISRSSYREARLAGSSADLMFPKTISGATLNDRVARQAPAFRPGVQSAPLTHGRLLSICVTYLLFEIAACGCGDSSPRKIMSELAAMFQIL